MNSAKQYVNSKPMWGYCSRTKKKKKEKKENANVKKRAIQTVPKCTPKVRNFMWRPCSNNLPTRDNLRRRKVHSTGVCGLCQQKTETTGHVLWECPLARNVWALVKGKIQKCSNEACDFFLLFGFMVQSLDQRDLELWATVAWAIWNA